MGVKVTGCEFSVSLEQAGKANFCGGCRNRRTILSERFDENDVFSCTLIPVVRRETDEASTTCSNVIV